MGDIKDKILERRAMEGMDENALIQDISVGVDYILSIKGKYSNGGTPTRYSTKTTKWSISKKQAQNIIDIEDTTSWINNNITDFEDYSFGTYKGVKSTVYLVASVHVELEYLNGGKISGMREIELDGTGKYSPVTDAGEGSYVKVISESEGEFTLEFENESVSFTRKGSTNESRMTNVVEEYLSTRQRSFKARFKIEEKEDCLSVSIMKSDVLYEMTFIPPFNNSSKVWELSRKIGFEDPFRLDDIRCEVSLNGVAHDDWCQVSFLRLAQHGEKVSKTRKLSSMIRSLFSFR